MVIALIAIAAAIYFLVTSGTPADSPDDPTTTPTSPTDTPTAGSPTTPAGVDQEQAVVTAPGESVPADLTPSLVEAGSAPVYSADCLGVMTLADKPSCWAGDVDSDRNVVVFGDSHAAHFMPALDQIGQQRGLRILPMVLNACPSLDMAVDRLPDGASNPYCQTWRDAQLQAIDEADPELIILSNQTELYTDLTPAENPDPQALLQEGLNGMLDQLPAGVPVVILSDSLTWPEAPTRCLAVNLDSVSECALPLDFEPLYLATSYESLVADREHVSVVDILEMTCVDQCYAIHDNMLIYQDTDHFSQVFIQWLTPALDQAIFTDE
ncbi:MAG: SGNH hydrolase domain-containing protein [Actinomycetia bacterium]|nr:SGNH hydrolase domain-containing protein [Actinomycetes bacterium]